MFWKSAMLIRKIRSWMAFSTTENTPVYRNEFKKIRAYSSKEGWVPAQRVIRVTFQISWQS